MQRISVRQVKAARALLRWSQKKLAERSSVSIPTIKRLESAEGPIDGRPETIKKIIGALEAGGVTFTGGGVKKIIKERKDNSTGFRWLGYEDALAPATIRDWFDPPHGVAASCAFAVAPWQMEAGQTLDRLARRLIIDDPESMDDPCLSFILAADKIDPGERLRAVVSRAFWRADEYAAAVAKRRDNIESLGSIVDSLDKIFEIAAGPDGFLWDKGHPSRGLRQGNLIDEFIGMIERYRFESVNESEGRREDVRKGLAALDIMRSQARRIMEAHCTTGRNPDDGRFFFVLRLAEVYVILSGRLPEFQDNRKQFAHKRNAPEWGEFVRTALCIVGLGNQGLDNLLKRLGGKGGNAKAYQDLEEYRAAIATISEKTGVNFEIVEDRVKDIAEIDELKKRSDAAGASGNEDEVFKVDDPFAKDDHVGLTRKALIKLPLDLNLDLREQVLRVRDALQSGGKSAEDLMKLRAKEHKASAGEAIIRHRLDNLHEFSKTRHFSIGHLPSSGALADYKLAPEPADYLPCGERS